MTSNNNKNLQYFVVIVIKDLKDEILSVLSDYNAHLIEIIYVHGTIRTNPLVNAFGLDCNECKVMISGLLKYENAKELIRLLYENYKFDKHNTGIAYSISVDSLSF